MEPEKTEVVAPTVEAPEPSQIDNVKQELEKVTKQQGRTEAEKAAHALRKNADRARELGIDVEEVLGVKSKELDSSAPMTVGMYEEIRKNEAQKTALQLADEIPDESERELTRVYLETRIRPSGNAQEDFRFARAAVNAVKTGQILEETARAGAVKTHGSSPGAPLKQVAPSGELTTGELAYTKAPWNMSKEQIIAARPKS